MPVSSPLSVSLVVDREHRITYASPCGEDFYGDRIAVGIPVAEALGTSWLAPGGAGPVLERLFDTGRWCGTTEHATRGGPTPVAIDARLQAGHPAQGTGVHLEVRPLDDRGRRAGDGLAGRHQIGLDRLERLRAISSHLVTVSTLQEIAAVVCGEAVDGVGAFGAALSLVRSDQRLEMFASCGYPADLLPRWNDLTRWEDEPAAVAARTAHPVWVGAEHPPARGRGSVDVAALAQEGGLCALPLMVAGTALGTLSFSFASAPPFDRDDRNFLLTVAAQCAHAVARVHRRAIPPPPSISPGGALLVLETSELTAVASRARRLVNHILDDDTSAQVRSDLHVIVTELCANAALHSGPPLRLTVERLADRYRIEVDDNSTELPVRRSPMVGEFGGRGVMIVDALSDRWGVTPRPWGKTVWAEVASPLPSQTA